jgi:hypothetical protein
MEDAPPSKFEWLSKNLAWLSGGCLLLSFAVALRFISSYFAVFDFNLIWTLEYPDLTKLTIVLFTFLTFSSAIYVNFIQQSYFAKTPFNRYMVYAAVAILVGVELYQSATSAIRSSGDLRLYYIDRATFVVTLSMLFALFAINGERIFRTNTLEWIFVIAFLVFALIGGAGSFYGRYVKSVSTSYVTASTKQEVLSGAKLIAMFSHHVALY